MRTSNKVGIGYLVVFSLVYGVGFLGYGLGRNSVSCDHGELEPSAPLHDMVKHDDKVEFQDAYNSWHEFKVVTRNGKVTPNGVIHIDKCKCKSNGKRD